MNEIARKILSPLIRDDMETEERIRLGIESNRKAFATVKLKRNDGSPVEKAEVVFRQTRHEYRFGCNAFMLQQFDESEKNEIYEKEFARLFNLAVLPFYWKDLEPEEGKVRFSRESPKMYRRPAIDTLLDYCEKYGITPKGHPLTWHEFIPDWAPADKRNIEARWERRIKELAERYGDRIKIWDVCNEALQWNPVSMATMPDEHVEKAFRIAGKYFPASTELLYNDGPWMSWNNFHGDYTPLYLLARHLKGIGLPIRGLGLQYHLAFFENVKTLIDWSHQMLSPKFLFAHMDQYAKLGLPLNVSEITITAHEDLGAGQRFQELVTEKLYRIWFSHAATNGIIWWNLVDGTASGTGAFNFNQGENQYRGGLLNSDMTRKPAFKVLDRLINKEWHSEGVLSYEDGAENHFKGFYGEYELLIKTDSGTLTRALMLSKDAKNEFAFTI